MKVHLYRNEKSVSKIGRELRSNKSGLRRSGIVLIDRRIYWIPKGNVNMRIVLYAHGKGWRVTAHSVNHLESSLSRKLLTSTLSSKFCGQSQIRAII